MNAVDRARREFRVAKAQVHLRLHGVSVGSRPQYERRSPDIANEGKLDIGHRVTFGGYGYRVELRTGPVGVLSMGDRVLLNAGCSIRAAQSIRIGDDVRIAPLVAISDTNFHEVMPGEGVKVAPVLIGDDVWIGRASIVLPGVTVGDHAVIGAGSVVTKDVPSCSVVAGNPARILRVLPTPNGRRI